MRIDPSTTGKRLRKGFSLLEVILVMTIMGVLIALPVPRFQQALEQSKLDVAASHLRAIWAAERFYHLQHGRYGTLEELRPGTGDENDLIEISLVSGTTYYAYTLSLSADSQSFVATATHPNNMIYTGIVTMDQTGQLTSMVAFDGLILTPTLEPTP